MQEIADAVTAWLEQDKTIALATVTRTWGSAPRREGAKMAITSEQAIAGSVSGGCVEGAVIEHSQKVLKSGKAKLLDFGVADDVAWDVGLTCGGSIQVFVESLNVEWWRVASQLLDEERAFTTITIIDGEQAGAKALFTFDGTMQYHSDTLSEKQQSEFAQIARQTQTTQTIETQDTTVLVDVVASRPHLIIIGGVHVAIPLTQIAHTLGFRVSIIDPRRVFATEERFPDVNAIMHSYPDRSLPELGLDKNTYLAVLTHDPKIDDKALITALPSDAPYIGVLSSRKTHQKRIERLKAAGLSDELIERIYTPIGLNIATRTPEEIALSIMAQIIAVRNGANTK